MTTELPPVGQRRLRDIEWPRFLASPGVQLLDQLYVPALGCSLRYDRMCAYFTSNVLSAAARGYGGLIETLRALGDEAPKSAIRLLVNEQLDKADIEALLARNDTSGLEKKLLKGLTSPRDALEKNRLQMLGWLVKQGLLEIRVGVMPHTHGILHAKYGIVTDQAGDALAFIGSGNETEAALLENFEEWEIRPEWVDSEFVERYRARFDDLWNDREPNVRVVPLPEAVRQKLITFAPPKDKVPEAELIHDRKAAEAAILWHYLAAAPYLADGAYAMDATAPVTLWEHQKRVVEDTANAFPAGRLLCDEVGMGKTVEAILVLRRLLAGRGVKRALLLVPAGLMNQWQAELREKGGLLVPQWDGGYLIQPNGDKKQVEAEKALGENDLLLVSREWARLPKNRQVILAAKPWDLTLMDEAHHARRASQIESEFNSANLLLELLREMQLRGRTRGILLMSATPMQTQPWEPWDLLQVLGVGDEWLVDFADIRNYYDAIALLKAGSVTMPELEPVAKLVAADPGFPALPVAASEIAAELPFADEAEMRRVADTLRSGSPLARRMHRNTRDTLRTYFKQHLLASEPPSRQVLDVVFDFETPAERAAYESITGYIDRRFDELEAEKGGKGFVMTVYKRRASSSPHALRESLNRRHEICRNVSKALASANWLDALQVEVDVRDLGDAGLDDRIDPGAPTTVEAADKEMKEILSLLAKLDALGGQDSKLWRFMRVLEEVTKDGRAALVFTEYADTMEYLRDQLKPMYGATLACYSGSGGQVLDQGEWKSVSKAEITERLAAGRIRVLVCTDAASEGLNLQAAGALINYDLPWNPSKVEQRIGRIDRIGQSQKVLPIRNLFLKNSVDESVYRALRERCGLFEHFVGQMQPVLSIGRNALRSNLRGPQLQASLNEMKSVANQLRTDAVAEAAYAESPAEPAAKHGSPVTAEDVANALGRLTQVKGKATVRKLKDGWSLPHGAKGGRVALSREALEADSTLQPFTLLDARSLAELLPLGGQSPLVVVTAEEGPFRVSEVRWVTADGCVRPDSASQLSELVDAWDNSAPAAAHLRAARVDAENVAKSRLADLRDRASTEVQAALDRQVAAARSRLLIELARNVRLHGEDLPCTYKRLVQTEKDPNGRYHRAYDSLGGMPTWTQWYIEMADAYVANLSQQDRRNIINLPTPLDAALNDPRWRARTRTTG